jgi:hypothetical protein
VPTQPYKVKVDRSKVNPLLLPYLDPVKQAEGALVRVPGTTTVIGRYKDSQALIAWANRIGLEGIPYAQALQKAADAGTLAHLMVEHDIRGLPEPDTSAYPPEVVDKAASSFIAYLDWKKLTKVTPHKTELSLTSQEWLFGGTIDAVQIDGSVALLDWKTSNGIYADHLIQVGGAYALLWEENFPEQPINGGIHLLRFSKTEGDMTHHRWTNLSVAKEAFKLMRASYEIDRILKTRL